MKKILGIALSALFVAAVVWVIFRWSIAKNLIVGSSAA